jgi:DNA repair protein RadC
MSAVISPGLDHEDHRTQLIGMLEEHLRQRDALTCFDDVKHLCQAILHPYQEEVYLVIYLDEKRRLLRLYELHRRHLTGVTHFLRLLVKPALEQTCTSIVLAHTKGVGDPNITLSDTNLTKRVQHILDCLGINLLDHVVVGKGIKPGLWGVSTFTQEGLL